MCPTDRFVPTSCPDVLRIWKPLPEEDRFAPLDLLLDADTLARQLVVRVGEGEWWDAFLLAAGLCQVLEDAVRPTVHGLRRVQAALAAQGSHSPDGLELGLRVAESLCSITSRSSQRTESLYLDELKILVDMLAWMSIGDCTFADLEELEFERRARMVLLGLGRALPRSRDNVLRIPSCFKSFDQRPGDLGLLVDQLDLALDLRERPVHVVGVRTSGSYLAPLVTLLLAQRGIPDVSWTTTRPHWPLSAEAKAQVRRVREGDGYCVVVDDPPGSGRALRTVFGQLESAGLPRERRIGLFSTFPSSQRALELLEEDAMIVDLPWAAWEIRRMLEPTRVQRRLSGQLVRGAEIARLRVVGGVTEADREHASAVFEATVRTPAGLLSTEMVFAEGVGTGFFGRHARAVADAIPELVPEVLAYEDGLLFRRPVPSELHAERISPSTVNVAAVAAHFALRAERLEVVRDRSVEVRGRHAVWEVASQIVSQIGGRMNPGLRAIVDPLMRTLLWCDEPALVDGRPALAGWDAEAIPAYKRDFFEGSFSHRDLACYDVTYDVAGVASCLDDQDLAEELRREYVLRSGRSIDPEHWMLYRWVRAWDEWRLGGISRLEWSRRSASHAQHYFAERFLDDLAPAADGPWAALDLDGVLETSPLGFAATTRAGALALRALRAHGRPVVFVTGRSLSEAVERCHAYGAIGAVAEYGTVVYDHRRRRTRDVVSIDPGIDRSLRAAAEAMGLEVDPDYTRIVRVGWRGADGIRRGAARSEQDELLADVGGRYRAVIGEEQTDFVPVEADKAHGLIALQALVGGEGDFPSVGTVPAITFAIGDAPSDVGFLRLASASWAPANASAEAKRHANACSAGHYQQGLFEAVGRLVGHDPGSCPRCAAAPVDASAEALVWLLSLRENGWHGTGRRLARATRALGRARAAGPADGRS